MKKYMGNRKLWGVIGCLALSVLLFTVNRRLWAESRNTHEAISHSAEVTSHGGEHDSGGHGDTHGGGEHGGGHGDTHGGGEHGGGGHGGGHGEVVAGPVTTEVSAFWGNLPMMILMIPLIACFLYVRAGDNHKKRDTIRVATTAIVFLLIMSLYFPVVQGIHAHGHLYRKIAYSLSYLPGFSFNLYLDPASVVVAAVVAFLWLLSAIYSITYMKIEDERLRFDFFTMASLNSSIGVMFAGDFLSLFIFFEGLIIFPYALVAHKEDGPSLRGANFYLYLGAASSLSLLFGIGLLYHFTGSVMIQPVATAVNLALAPSVKYWIALFMIVGFGGKAGLFLEHIWLPNAHPVAPTPASCLLSGAMIKAGAYGIFRVVCMLFVPPHWDMTKHVAQWATMSNIGYAIIWVGIVTMFMGVLGALISANSKRMLAFHSVSQMGYIVMGIGCGAYMGSDGAMGLAGGIYHIVNHALFKASLFICVGAYYYQTHELDMYKLGGMMKKMPVVSIGLLIAACGIAGIPGFNGFASKTLLHHAILEAYDHSVHLGHPDFKLRIAEIIFMITAGGTFASNMKLFVLTSLGDCPKKYDKGHHAVGPASTPFRVTIIMVSAAILFVGLNPNWMLENFIGPALQYFNFNPSSHAYHLIYNTHAAVGESRSIIPILYPITGIADAAMSTWGDVIHNLNGGGIAVLLGGMYFIIGMPLHWYHFVVPEKAEFSYYYLKVIAGFKWFCVSPVSAFGDFVARVIVSPRTIMTDGFKNACINIFSPFGDIVDRVVMAPVRGFINGFVNVAVNPVSTFGDMVDTFVMSPVRGFIKGFVSVAVNPVSSFGDRVDRFLMTPVWGFIRGFIKLAMYPVSAFGDAVDRVMMKPVWPTIESFEKLMKHPLSTFGDFVDRLIMRPMVFFWLPLSNKDSFIEQFEERYIPRFVYEKEIWQKWIAKIYLKNAEIFKFTDSGIDSVVNAVADGTLKLGELPRKTQTGFTHIYAAAIVVGLILMIGITIFFGY